MWRYCWILTLLTLFGCTPALKPEVYSDEAIIEDVDVRTVSRVSADRRSASFVILNQSQFDIFCEGVVFRAVADNPDTYLEIGETQAAALGVFIRASQSVTSNENISSLNRSTGNWRSAETLISGANCRRAAFLDFCRFGERTEIERAHLVELFLKFNAGNCERLYRSLEARKRLNLQDFNSVSVRPAIYLEDLREVKLPARPESEALWASLKSLSRSPFLARIE